MFRPTLWSMTALRQAAAFSTPLALPGERTGRRPQDYLELSARSAAGFFGAISGFSDAAQRQRRDWADALLYDLDRLDERSLQTLARAGSEAVAVAHPKGRRAVAVYDDAERWALSLDRDVRVMALISPGSSMAAAAAFARQTADALGEPVAAAAPPRTLRDLLLDLSTPLENGLGAAVGPNPGRPGLTAPLALLRQSRRGFRLFVCHRLGARLLGDLLAADEARTSGGQPPVSAAARIVTIGGASAPLGRQDAVHVIGAQDWYGWAISDPTLSALRVAACCGGHLRPAAPGALPFETMLCDAAADLGCL